MPLDETCQKMEHYPQHSELFPKLSKSKQAKQKVEDFVIPPIVEIRCIHARTKRPQQCISLGDLTYEPLTCSQKSIV